MKRKIKRKNKIIFRNISIAIWILMIISYFMLTCKIVSLDILPGKYYLIVATIALILILLFFIFTINKKTKKYLLIIFNLIFITISAACFYGYAKIDNISDFMKQNFGTTYDTSIYYVLVNSKSEYSTTDSIKGKKIVLVDDINDKETLQRAFNKKIDVEYEYIENISEALYELKENNDMILIVNSGIYDSMLKNDENTENELTFSDNVKILETLEIRFKNTIDESKINITKEPFVVYISGIDTISDKIPSKSTSDINIIIAVNPKTHKISVIETPKDYYIQLNGVTGLKDRLTHSGLVGGYNLSIKTLEDLYGININYYARISFNAVENIVDTLGGITINSEVDYNFTCKANNNCIIKPGLNNLDGKCALAFARESKAYETGELHKRKNQEQVIERIAEKLANSTDVVAQLEEILESMSGTFQTNITEEEISALSKMQIDEMAQWSVSVYNVTGKESYEYTYSYPTRKLRVIIPEEKTIEMAKSKLKEVLKK